MPVPFDYFTTARLVAERLTREHMPEVHSQDRDERFMALIGGVRTEDETNRRFDGAFKHWDEHGYGVWLLRDRATDRIIGRAVLRHLEVEGVDELEIGYAFREEFWGRGLATEVARGIVDLARRELGRNSFVALTDPRHDASRHVLEKAGFSHAGTFTHEGTELNLFRARWPDGGGAAPAAGGALPGGESEAPGAGAGGEAPKGAQQARRVGE